jgi:hypothetical protein
MRGSMFRESSSMEAAMVRFFGRCWLSAVLGFVFTASSPVGPLLAGQPVPVDVELVVAVDISYSMDYDELALQRDGYVQAFTSKAFLDALRKGAHGRIAVTYVEWAGTAEQSVVVPWRLIESPETADAFAQEIAKSPLRRAYRTSISGALMFSAALFKDSGFKGIRKVIDVSGDGTNNQGPLVEPTRDEVIAKGITINGLPIQLKTPLTSMIDLPDLEIYYEDCVIGGPAAFVIPVRERSQFPEAIRRKLVLEIATIRPQAERHVAPVVNPPRVSCTIGERMWQQRWGG